MALAKKSVDESKAYFPDSLILQLENRREIHKKGLGKTYTEQEVLNSARALSSSK